MMFADYVQLMIVVLALALVVAWIVSEVRKLQEQRRRRERIREIQERMKKARLESFWQYPDRSKKGDDDDQSQNAA